MIEVSSGGDQFPELRILAGHIGVPWLGEMLSLVKNDTSAYKVIRYPKDLVDYMRRSNRQKVLFGSNHPFWPACECLADFDKLGLSEKGRDVVPRGQRQKRLQAQLRAQLGLSQEATAHKP